MEGPGVIIDAIGQLQKQHQVLRAQVELAVRSASLASLEALR
jgi:hypothetical protein